MPQTVMRNDFFPGCPLTGGPALFHSQAWESSVTVVTVTNKQKIVGVNAHMFTGVNLKLNLKKMAVVDVITYLDLNCYSAYLTLSEVLGHVDGSSFELSML